jgi:Thioredoxin-like [2Fe-2S] ferredoxin
VGEVAGIKPGETTCDGKLSLLTARCVGSCGLAPAVVFDGQVAGKITTESIKQRVAACLVGELGGEYGGEHQSMVPDRLAVEEHR